MVNTQDCSNKNSATTNKRTSSRFWRSTTAISATSTASSIKSVNTTSNACNDTKQSTSSSSSTSISSSSLSSAVKASSVNYARNAAANHHKLIPIQSVLTTAADAHNHQTHTSRHHHHHHHNHNHNFNQSTAKSLPLQTGSDKALNSTQLHVPSSKAQKLLVSATTHAQLPTELPQEDEERLEKLFKQLDRDGNGRIDIHDLSEALREFGLSSVYVRYVYRNIYI
ncbi:uncharacterized protein ACN427_005078 [Glossina fuscipes fuscipes]